jgi:hypothetical protein
MVKTLEHSAPMDQDGPDMLVRGRYEAVVSPSNFVGASRYDSPGIGRLAAGVDFENDDLADVLDNTPPSPRVETYGGGDLTSDTPFERAVAASHDSKYQRMTEEYRSLIAAGVSHDEARAEVARKSGYGR